MIQFIKKVVTLIKKENQRARALEAGDSKKRITDSNAINPFVGRRNKQCNLY